MKQIKVRIKGVAPLLQHRFPEEEHGENAKRAKKKVYEAKEEAEKALYRTKDGKIYHPAEHVFGAIVRAAVDFKFEGRKTYKDLIKGSVVIDPEQIPLTDDKGKEKKKWDEIDARPVVIQRSRVMCWRPKFNDWTLEFTVTILDDENLSAPIIKDILERAGATRGIGDFRPRFGRFQVVGFQEQK